MSDPVATVVRFVGDPADLLARFERARNSWVGAQGDYNLPAFYALCKSDTGITALIAWNTDADHRAFARSMAVHLKSSGMSTPDDVEHLQVSSLGWVELNAAPPARQRRS